MREEEARVQIREEDCVMWPFFIFHAALMMGKEIVFNSKVLAESEE